jgi:hypothetical protein
MTATLYLVAALLFYRAFRHARAGEAGEVRGYEEAKGLRGEGPGTD